MSGVESLLIFVSTVVILVFTFFIIWAWRLGAEFAREPVPIPKFGKFALHYMAFFAALSFIGFWNRSQDAGDAFGFLDSALTMVGPFLMMLPLIGFGGFIGWVSHADFSSYGWHKRYGPADLSGSDVLTKQGFANHRTGRDG